MRRVYNESLNIYSKIYKHYPILLDIYRNELM